MFPSFGSVAVTHSGASSTSRLSFCSAWTTPPNTREKMCLTSRIAFPLFATIASQPPSRFLPDTECDDLLRPPSANACLHASAEGTARARPPAVRSRDLCLQQETGTRQNNSQKDQTGALVGAATLVGVWSEYHLV